MAVQPIYYFAGGFYSKEYQDAKDLPENAKVQRCQHDEADANFATSTLHGNV